MKTEAQKQRQKSRDQLGKYIQHNVCEMCKGNTGPNYYSLPNCNTTGFGVILCKQCVSSLEKQGLL